MAQPTNTYATNDAIGNREDLSDIIYDVSPTATPFLTAIPKTKATSVKHEWLTRTLTAASSTNFVIEGDDATLDAAVGNTRLYNYTAISDKTCVVSGTQEKVSKAGKSSEMADQMEMKMKELKRDVEKILLENNAHTAGNDTNARECAGAQAYIITAYNKASDATLPTGDGTDGHTDGTARPIQESFVESVLATAWSNGGEPSLGIMNAFQKRKFAAFTGNSTPTMDGNGTKVVNSVDIYIDPLGTEVRLVPCRQAPTDVVYFFDPSMVKFAVLRDFQTSDLARTGDSLKKQILVEYTLEVCTEKAHGIISDLSAS